MLSSILPCHCSPVAHKFANSSDRRHLGRPCTFRIPPPLGYTGRRRQHLSCWLKKRCGVHQRVLPAWLAAPTTLLCGVVAALSAIAAGFALSLAFASQADVPLYQRRGAFEAACGDAGDA